MELMEFHLIYDSSRQQYWFDNTVLCSLMMGEEIAETCRAIYRNK
jgi:hypothetical protein